MMRVRRAPREVYRVYSEDEFFREGELLAGGVADERHVGSARGADQRWQTAAGVTIAAAAIGAIGGVVALTWVAPVPRGGRRATAALLPAAGSIAPSHLAGTHVWGVPSNVEGPRPRGVSTQRGAAARARRRAGTPVRAAGARRSPGVGAREQLTKATVAMTPASYEVAAVSDSGGSAGSAPGMSESAQPLHPAHAAASEFGFER
jgi:hypothetical protein